MNLQIENTYVLNAQGDVDVNYYLIKAQKLRSAAVRAFFSKIANTTCNTFQNIGSAFHPVGHAR